MTLSKQMCADLIETGVLQIRSSGMDTCPPRVDRTGYLCAAELITEAEGEGQVWARDNPGQPLCRNTVI